jgi:hypothetical protein
VFEEPSTDTHFFLFLPSADVLLPTLRSRLALYDVDGKTQELPDVSEFLSATSGARMKLVGSIEEKRDLDVFIESLENVLHTKFPNSLKARETLLLCRKYFFDTSFSVKHMRDYLALTFPRI